MSPILVRPVREQLEHDRVIRLLQAKYKRKFEVAINPGNEQTAPVGPAESPWYPDLVLLASERTRKLVGVVEVETSESINHLEAMSQWKTFSSLNVQFHLYVPVSGVDSARRLCADHQIVTTEIWAYHAIGDQIRFTPVQRAPQAADGKGRAAAEPREPAAPAKPAAAKPADSIAPGGDGALFRIDPFTGLLSWAQPPQFNPSGSNFYSVTVNASDGQLTGFQTIQLTVNHVNHVTIVSDGGYDWAQVSVDENQTAVTTVSAMDDDGAPLTYSITGGEDASFFTIDSQTGVLSFVAAPDYEQPQGNWSDNFYEVEVTASDGTRSDTQMIGVNVNDVEEPLGFAITSDGGGDEAELHRPENGLAVTTVKVSGAAGPVTYEIVGGVSAGYFDIDPGTGVLSFRGPPDFETGPYGPGAWWYDPYNYPFP